MKSKDENTNSKKEIEELVQEWKSEEITESETIRETISSTKYFEWLKEFTKDKDYFGDDDWLYHPEELSNTDRKNVENLYFFYEGIDKYATKNHIYPTNFGYGYFYTIKLDESAFEIGIMIGQGAVCFCKKTKVDDESKFIDFNDIINDKKSKQVDFINSSLNEIHGMILNAYNSGVPIESINGILKDAVNEINKLADAKVKKLQR